MVRIGMVGTYPPTPSGIADYNNFLSQELAQSIDVVFLSNALPENPIAAGFTVTTDARKIFSDCEVLHFQFGNNPFDAFVLEVFRQSLAHEIPRVATLHDMQFLSPTSWIYTRVKKPHLPLSSLNAHPFVVRNSDCLIVHSKFAKDHYVARYGNADKFRVILHGMPFDSGHQTPVRSTISDCLQLSTFGYIFPRKGYGEVIGALHRLVQDGVPFHYTLIGGAFTPYHWYLDLLTRRYRLTDRITSLGYVPRSDFDRLFSSTDIFLQPRKSTNEGCSGSLLHALISGSPVLASDTGYHPEYITDHVTGILVDHSPAAIHEGLAELCSNPSLRSTLATNAYDWCRAHLDWKILVPEYREIYHGLTRS